MNRPLPVLLSALVVLLSLEMMRRDSEVLDEHVNVNVLKATSSAEPSRTSARCDRMGRRDVLHAPRSNAPTLPTDDPGPPLRLSDLKSLAETDPSQAISALEELLANTETPEIDNVVTWLTANTSHAADWIESLPDGPVRNGVVERLLANVAARHSAAALTIAEALDAPELRDSAVSSVVRRWAANAPTDALSAIAARDDWRDSPILGRAFLAAVTEHPRQIAELFALVPEHAIDLSFFTSAAESLLAKDPSALKLWGETLQDPEHRSAIAEAVVLHAGRHGPELAFAWATQLNATDRRQEALRVMFRRAVNRDAGSAPALLDSPWLSNDDRTALLSRLSQEQSTQSR